VRLRNPPSPKSPSPKSSRRQAILEAAETLVRDTRATDFPMLELAKRARVSPATPYNVFGTKASILYALLNQSLDGIFSGFVRAPGTGPFEVVLAAADQAASFFVTDPNFYRPLYQHLIGAQDPVHRPAYMDRALEFWRGALAGLCEAGYVSGESERDSLARAIMIIFVGALDMWVQAELDSKEFRAHILHGVSLLLFASADERSQRVLRQAMRSAAKAMPRNFSFSRVLSL
jgi:AcrR family transcriptional regulator